MRENGVTQFRVTPELIEAWRPWWLHDLRALPTEEARSELEYTHREIAERVADPLIEDGYLDPGSHTAGLLARRELLEQELARRARYEVVGENREARKRLVDFSHDMKDRLELHVYLEHQWNLGLKRVGRAYEGLCPFHQERTPSFIVHSPTWHCFGCNQGGDVYEWLFKAGKASTFTQAVRIVADYLGIAMPATRTPLERIVELRAQLGIHDRSDLPSTLSATDAAAFISHLEAEVIARAGD